MKKIKFLMKISSHYFLIVCVMLMIANSCLIFAMNGLADYYQYVQNYKKSSQNDYVLRLQQPQNDYHLQDYEQKFIQQFLDNKQVQNQKTITQVQVTSYHIKAIDDEQNSNQQNEDHFQLNFYSHPQFIDDFVTKNRVIVEGNMLDEFTNIDNGCLISEELARANNLQVGSVLTFFHKSNWNLSFYFRVVGIYQDYTTSQTSSINRRNEIISHQEVYEMISKRYDGIIEIPHQNTYLFNGIQSEINQIKQNMPACFEIEPAYHQYTHHLLIFKEYNQLMILVFVLSIIFIVSAIGMMKHFCIPYWKQLYTLTQNCLFELKKSIKRFQQIISFFIFVIPFFINSIFYNMINHNLIYHIVNRSELFSQDTIGTMISSQIFTYYQNPLQQYMIQFDILTNIIIILCIVLFAKILMKYFINQIERGKSS